MNEPEPTASAPVDSQSAGSVFPGLTEDETRYFQWGLCQHFDSVTRRAWDNLATLNQKILKAQNDKMRRGEQKLN